MSLVLGFVPCIAEALPAAFFGVQTDIALTLEFALERAVNSFPLSKKLEGTPES